jgi:hypothetical protein
MHSIKRFCWLSLCLCMVSAPHLVAWGESKTETEASFAPTWRLLKGDSKQQFVAGYLFAWRDAARVTDAAIEYAREHPQNAVTGLERIRGIYDMEGLTAESMARELDKFFTESDGREATLSQAMTAVRSRLGR